MRFIRSTLIIGFIVCFINVLNAEDLKVKVKEDTTTTTSTTTPAPTTTTSATTTPTTTTSTTTTTTTTTTEAPTTTTTTKAPTTTTTTTTTTSTPEPTTTTTIAPTTTTTAAPSANVHNYTVPKDTTLPLCLRAQFALVLNITYEAKVENTTSNATASFILGDSANPIVDYTGVCGNDSFNTLDVTFRTNWRLVLNYTLDKNGYQLDSVQLNYTLDVNAFPNTDAAGSSVSTTENGLKQFHANKGQSYKCFDTTTITIPKVQLVFSKYQAQPFSDPKSKNYDTAVECNADNTNTSELVPIIVGSALAVLVIFVLIAYIIGRRKHRPGYQQV